MRQRCASVMSSFTTADNDVVLVRSLLSAMDVFRCDIQRLEPSHAGGIQEQEIREHKNVVEVGEELLHLINAHLRLYLTLESGVRRLTVLDFHVKDVPEKELARAVVLVCRCSCEPAFGSEVQKPPPLVISRQGRQPALPAESEELVDSTKIQFLRPLTQASQKTLIIELLQNSYALRQNWRVTLLPSESTINYHSRISFGNES